MPKSMHERGKGKRQDSASRQRQGSTSRQRQGGDRQPSHERE